MGGGALDTHRQYLWVVMKTRALSFLPKGHDKGGIAQVCVSHGLGISCAGCHRLPQTVPIYPGIDCNVAS